MGAVMPRAGADLISDLALIDAHVSEILDRDRRQFDVEHAVILESIARRLGHAARRIRMTRPARRGSLAEALNSDRA